MLSILIPIYNFDVRSFVKQLSEQANRVEQPVEIICLDDASEESFRSVNKELSMLDNVRCLQSETNLGRSAVRNALVQKAQYENLLILDCDGRCLDDQYLERYIESSGSYDVIYGGRVYNEEAPDDHDLNFHWYCGSVREAILVEDRKRLPYKSFMTNNFLIRKAVYEAIKMNESLEGYGHEDTLFAQELKRNGYRIDHVENPIEHIGLEPFEEFMRKSENAVRNLAQLIALKKVDQSIRLVKFYDITTRYKLLGLIAFIERIFRKGIFNNLSGPAPNLLWFDLWKLSMLHRFMQAY